MRAGSTDPMDKILHLRRDRTPVDRTRHVPGADTAAPAPSRAGEAIIERLRQAADASARNEERARAQAEHLAAQLQSAERRIEELEQDLQRADRRAHEAEQWLDRVLHEAQDIFLGPPVARPSFGLSR